MVAPLRDTYGFVVGVVTRTAIPASNMVELETTLKPSSLDDHVNETSIIHLFIINKIAIVVFDRPRRL